MKSPQGKKKLATSSAAIISIGLHVAIILAAGSWIAFRFIVDSGKTIQVEQQKKFERRKLQMPVKTEPFIEQMSKPKTKTTSSITASTPQLVNIPESGDFVRLAPVQTFQEEYTNFVSIDRTLEFNSKYRTIDFGVSALDFFGARGKTEKAIIVIDTSKSMLYDDRGGPDSYEMVRDDLANIVEGLRSATLFNLVAFDDKKVSLFKQSMTPAKPDTRKAALKWFGAFNTNLVQVGVSDQRDNYASQKEYDIPMNQNDVRGWLKGYQAAAEQQADMIFLLSSQWGSIETKQTKISYFINENKREEYEKERANYFLIKDHKEEMDEFMEEFNEHRDAALTMLELENEARLVADMEPKIVRDWDEILEDNDIELPPPPPPENQKSFRVTIGETRYTMTEVLESFFAITVDNYEEKEFPKLNLVLLRGENAAKNTAESTSLLTSDAKFKALAKMCNGRFRYLEGMSQIDNLLTHSLVDIKNLNEDAE